MLFTVEPLCTLFVLECGFLRYLFLAFELELLLLDEGLGNARLAAGGLKQQVDELLHKDGGLVFHEACEVKLHLFGAEVVVVGLSLLKLRVDVGSDNFVLVGHQLEAALLNPGLKHIKLYFFEVDGFTEGFGPLPLRNQLFVFVLELHVLLELGSSEELSSHSLFNNLKMMLQSHYNNTKVKFDILPDRTRFRYTKPPPDQPVQHSLQTQRKIIV